MLISKMPKEILPQTMQFIQMQETDNQGDAEKICDFIPEFHVVLHASLFEWDFLFFVNCSLTSRLLLDPGLSFSTSVLLCLDLMFIQGEHSFLLFSHEKLKHPKESSRHTFMSDVHATFYRRHESCNVVFLVVLTSSLTKFSCSCCSHGLVVSFETSLSLFIMHLFLPHKRLKERRCK